MVSADVFLNPKHAANTKQAVASVLQYLGNKLGVTQSDLAALSPKLGSQIAEAVGSASESSRKRRSEGDSVNVGSEKKKKNATAPERRASKKRAQPDPKDQGDAEVENIE